MDLKMFALPLFASGISTFRCSRHRKSFYTSEKLLGSGTTWDSSTDEETDKMAK